MSSTPELGPAAPTPPITLATPVSAHTATPVVEVTEEVLTRLRDACAHVEVEPLACAEASRDWWPLAMTWALEGEVGGIAGAVVRPESTAEVAEIARICNGAAVPLTAAAGRSGVCGSSIPVHGGVVIDFCGLAGITDVDTTSTVLDVLPGTFGDHLEDELRREHQVTLGHWPQSIALSTVGGWLACRGAGQLSNRYGKIEDMVVGLDVVLADGTLIHTGGNARSANGPDLNQLFVGSEGTLGLITGARLRLHHAPVAESRAAYGFSSFADGLEACRRITQRGAPPAVLRLYDDIEGSRNFDTGAGVHPLLLLDEGEPAIVAAVMAIAAQECGDATVLPEGDAIVERWLGHRNDVAALEKYISGGLVVDTMEITGPWAALPAIYADTVDAIKAVEGTLAASAHQSHAYPDGACIYFTFAGKTSGSKDDYYRAVWDAGTRSVLGHGGSLSHHHGVGLNRARFMAEALGPAFDTLVSVKHALDPVGILNPGKLGLPSRFGEVAWP